MTSQPRRKLLILTYHRLQLWIAPAWFGERLQKEFPSLWVEQWNSYDHVEEHIADAEILYGISLRPEQFLAAKNCAGSIHKPRRFTSSCFPSW